MQHTQWPSAQTAESVTIPRANARASMVTLGQPVSDAIRCPSDCSGRGLCYSAATLASQYGPSSLAGAGPTYTNWEKDSMTNCMCDMGYTGPDCSQSIQSLEAAQDTIRRLRPVTFEWRRDEFPSRNLPAGVFPGFIADEVEEVLPDLVHEDGDGWKSLNYVGVVPHLVRAVQEMQEQLEASQAQMARMQQQIDALQAAAAA
ncbi:Endosialidase chaperone [Phytophthora cinnamomi]|uniref:Endosialidase chaperone n=1 Tax=Phytophthora cinnamomi TaxID=4785 RepID=UPI00355A37AC|nr:Endosialidase chaperone [Phytophthora cinnamomi]